MKAILGAIVAAAAVYVAFAAGTGRALPFGVQPKMAVWIVLGLGMTACGIAGIGDVVARAGNDWTSPWVLAGIVCGIAALAVTWAAAAGTTLGIVPDARQWLLVLAAIIGVKVLVAVAQGAVLIASATSGAGRG
jgi:hypothetical protein